MRQELDWLRTGRTGAVLSGTLLLFFAQADAESRYVGLTARGTRIEAKVVEGGSIAAPTVVLLGGLNGADESTKIVAEEARRLETTKASGRRVRLLAVALANPDGNKVG